MSDWTPEFAGQRPPFQPGNSTSVTHGAYSRAQAGQLGEQMLTELLNDEHTPPYLLTAAWRPQVETYCRQKALVELLWRAIAQLDDVSDLLVESEDGEEEVKPAGKGSRKTSRVRRTPALLNAWNLATGRLRTLANDLGLSPASHVKIVQAMASAEYLRAVGGKHALDIAVDRQLAEDQRRRELDAGGP